MSSNNAKFHSNSPPPPPPSPPHTPLHPPPTPYLTPSHGFATMDARPGVASDLHLTGSSSSHAHAGYGTTSRGPIVLDAIPPLSLDDTTASLTTAGAAATATAAAASSSALSGSHYSTSSQNFNPPPEPPPTANPNPPAPAAPRDSVQERLNSVSRRLVHPQFLTNISTSRLPSQAASDSSLSPGEAPISAGSTTVRFSGDALPRSPLTRAVGLDLKDSEGELLSATYKSGTRGGKGDRSAGHRHRHSSPSLAPVADLDRVARTARRVGSEKLALRSKSEPESNQTKPWLHIPTREYKQLSAAYKANSEKAFEAELKQVPPKEEPEYEQILAAGKAASDTREVEEKQLNEQLLIAAWKTVCKKVRMAAEGAFSAFPHGHADLVVAVDFNFYGTRMVTASSDHKLRVWDRKNEVWGPNPVDTWRAHDAEVTDAKWTAPFAGEFIGSIGEDGRLKVWQEDVLEMPNSSHRFKCIYSIRSPTKIPFMSLDFKPLMSETYMAAVTRDGHLTIYEPTDHDDLSADWDTMYSRYVCATPVRHQETSFRVAFHRERWPCWTAVEEGLDKKSMAVAVAAMNVVKVFRTDLDRKWYVAAELTGAKDLVRDVAWANGAMRGFDVLATASKDGVLRIYDLETPQTEKRADDAEAPGAAVGNAGQGTESRTAGDGPKPASPAPASTAPAPPHSSTAASATSLGRLTRPSGLTSSLTSGLSGGPAKEAQGKDKQQLSPLEKSRVKHLVKLAAELNAHGGPMWRVAFSQMGDLLISTGDDGSVKTWKRALNRTWMEYATVDVGSGHGD